MFHAEHRIGENLVQLTKVSVFHNNTDKCELLELSCRGSEYTWNDKHGRYRIFSKIDWAFINKAWLDNILVIITTFLEEEISDHCPLKISKDANINKAKKAFKYYMYGLNILSICRLCNRDKRLK